VKVPPLFEEKVTAPEGVPLVPELLSEIVARQPRGEFTAVKPPPQEMLVTVARDLTCKANAKEVEEKWSAPPPYLPWIFWRSWPAEGV
jgi:hypothetical protein